MGIEHCAAQGRKHDWAEGEIQLRGSPKGVLQLILQGSTSISHRTHLVPQERGVASSPEAVPHLRLMAEGHPQAALPAAGVMGADAQGACGHLLHTITPIRQERAK